MTVMTDYARIAELADARASAALDRFHDLVGAGGSTSPDPGRWARVIADATRELQTQNGAAFDDGQPLVPSPARRDVLPPGCVAVQADDVMGAASRIAELEHNLARAEQDRAEVCGRVQELERQLEEPAR